MNGRTLLVGTLLFLLVWGNLALDRRGARRGARGRGVAMGSVGLGPGQTFTLTPTQAKQRQSLTRRAIRWVIYMAEVRPAVTTVAAGLLAAGQWVALYVAGLTWWAALVPTAPASAVALYAAVRWRRRVSTDRWVALWDRLSVDVVDGDGKVTEKAVLPGSRVIRPVGRRRAAELVVDEATGLLREVVLRIRLGRVAQTVDHVAKASGVIAAVYLTYGDCVRVVEGGHKGEAIVRITTREWADRERAAKAERVASVVEWPDGASLDPATGLEPVGCVLADWSPALLDLHTPSWGARRIWMTGESGSGKTYGLDDILLAAVSSGVVVPHIIDLEDGPTLAGWERYAASYATTIPEAMEVWRALLDEHEARKTLLKRMARDLGVDVIPPSREHPLHLPVVDGGPRAVRDDAFMTCMRTAVFEWRKFSMGLIWVSQPGTAEAAFGKPDRGGTSVRDQFNVRIGFRAGKETSDAMFGDQSLLPSISAATPGVAFIQSPTYPTPTQVKFYLQRDARTLRARHADIPGWERPRVARQPEPWGTPESAPARGERSWAGVDDGHVAQVVELPGAGEPGYLRDPDPEARIRAVLVDGPRTEKELVAATRLSKTTVNSTLPRMAGVTKEAKYGGRWSLMERSQ